MLFLRRPAKAQFICCYYGSKGKLKGTPGQGGAGHCMSVVGRFEIVSPIFSGALDTSTARDSRTGETVLLHLLPAGRQEPPRDLFLEIACDWPGQVLDSGFDPATQRSFVVTEYPKDRKAFRLLIHTLGELRVPERSSAPPRPTLPNPAPGAADSAADLLAFFRLQTAPSPNSRPSEPAPTAGATRTFDPSAVFGSAAPQPADAHEKPTPLPAQDGATRIFDPHAVFGTAAVPEPAEAAAASAATRMFDPSAVFGTSVPAAAPSKPAPPAPAQDGATRIFDPSAIFGAPAANPGAPIKEKVKELSDSSKRAAEDFISGRLPPEFRDAPVKVQRSLEELLGRKAADRDKKEKQVQPTPRRPGAITLMFDAYGKRIESTEPSSTPDRDKAPPASEEAEAHVTKLISSADLSAFFAAEVPSKPPAAESESSRADSHRHPPDHRK